MFKIGNSVCTINGVGTTYVPYYSITYTSNIGNVVSGNLDSAKSGAIIYPSATIPLGYEFEGWSANSSKLYNNPAVNDVVTWQFRMSAENVTVSAQFGGPYTGAGYYLFSSTGEPYYLPSYSNLNATVLYTNGNYVPADKRLSPGVSQPLTARLYTTSNVLTANFYLSNGDNATICVTDWSGGIKYSGDLRNTSAGEIYNPIMQINL